MRVFSTLAINGLLLVTAGFFSVTVRATDPTPRPKANADRGAKYRKHDIVEARFGTSERRVWLEKAYQVRERLDANVFGQERATYALQEALIQYVESFGSRTKEPVALHFIGLPGIGKSEMVEELRRSGFDVYRIDMQTYASALDNQALNKQLYDEFNSTKGGRPRILLFDEIDKLPEITPEGEKTRPALSLINEILTDGKASMGLQLELSNVFVISTMNFDPKEIEGFSEKVLGAKKSYYSFTLEDFKKFDEWLTENPGARYEVLSKLFRSNTVSRIAPNTSIFKPLDLNDYEKIAAKSVKNAAKRATEKVGGSHRISVTSSDEFAKYIAKLTLVPASGARETVFRTDRLTDQLIGFAAKYEASEKRTADRPRKIHLDYNPATDQVVMSVTPQKLHGRTLVDDATFQFEVGYQKDVRLFARPKEVISAPPIVPAPKVPVRSEITQKSIFENRFPKGSRQAKDLSSRLDKVIIGQETYTRFLEDEMNKYLARPGPALKQPNFTVFAGFPGIGKSELINRTAADLNLPIIRIGMQQFTGDSHESVKRFAMELGGELHKLRPKNPSGKYILLIEEIDKIFEKNPMTGNLENRPVMGVLKDLLADGKVNVNISDNFSYELNIKDAQTFVTMNFGADLFNFEADPRLTTPEDMLAVWRKLSTRPADLQGTLKKIFLPETVSRLMPNFKIMKPLTREEYGELISGVVDQVISERMLDAKGLNRSQISIRLTPEYKKYLLSETMIPSEGARYTVVSSRSRLLNDIEFALKQINKSSRYAKKPFELVLNFSPRTSTLYYGAKLASEPRVSRIASRPIALTFPRIDTDGLLDPTRALISVHEFGHAYAGIRLGLRFETASAIAPKTGVGGYVKFIDNGMSARASIANVYSAVAARAMERVFYSETPLSKESVLAITSGGSGDIAMATEKLYEQIYSLGFDPNGGTLSRRGHLAHPTAKFSDIPSDQIEGIGRVLRRMEDQVVEDFLAAHSLDWYREKILAFGQKGIASEQEFYHLIDYAYPEGHPGFLGEEETSWAKLKGVIAPKKSQFVDGKSFRQGLTETTAKENLDQYLIKFRSALVEELHGGKVDCKALLSPAKEA